MEKKIKQKGVASFQGLNFKPNGTVQVKFKLRYDELLTSVNLLQALNNDVTIHAKCGMRKAVDLGIFTIGSVNFDRDGNATVPFNSLVQSVNIENLCSLVEVEKDEPIALKFMGVIELPDSNVKELEGGASEWED